MNKKRVFGVVGCFEHAIDGLQQHPQQECNEMLASFRFVHFIRTKVIGQKCADAANPRDSKWYSVDTPSADRL